MIDPQPSILEIYHRTVVRKHVHEMRWTPADHILSNRTVKASSTHPLVLLVGNKASWEGMTRHECAIYEGRSMRVLESLQDGGS